MNKGQAGERGEQQGEAKLRKKQETEQENGGQTLEERCKGGARRSTITVYIRRCASLIDLKPRRTRREWRRGRDGDAGSGVTRCAIGAANDIE